MPDCLPNAVQQHPDDRPLNVGRSPRVVHSPVPERRPFVFEEEEEENLYDDEADDDVDWEDSRLPVKSRSVASFAASSPSPDENARRQRSLPTRRHDSTTYNIRCHPFVPTWNNNWLRFLSSIVATNRFLMASNG